MHLGAHVLKAGRADDREADEEDVGLRVRQGPQAVVVLLAGRVPQAEVDGLAVDHDVGRVVVEHGRDVLALRNERDERRASASTSRRRSEGG